MKISKFAYRFELKLHRLVIASVHKQAHFKPASPISLSSLDMWQNRLLLLVSVLAMAALGGNAWFSAVTPQIASKTVVSQQKTLLIVVDDLTRSQPELQSVWLAVSADEYNQMIAPIYPGSLKGGAQEDERLRSAFGLAKNRTLQRQFENSLREKKIEWSSYVIIDNYVVESLVDILSGVDLGNGFLSGRQFISELSNPLGSRYAVLSGHAMMVKQLCFRSTTYFQTLNPEMFLDSFEGHLSTDISRRQWLQMWYDMRDRKLGLNCEFPTMYKALPSNGQ
jgi:hypothetical protein